MAVPDKAEYEKGFLKWMTQTVCTLIMGIAAMVEIFILSLIL